MNDMNTNFKIPKFEDEKKPPFEFKIFKPDAEKNTTTTNIKLANDLNGKNKPGVILKKSEKFEVTSDSESDDSNTESYFSEIELTKYFNNLVLKNVEFLAESSHSYGMFEIYKIVTEMVKKICLKFDFDFHPMGFVNYVVISYAKIPAIIWEEMKFLGEPEIDKILSLEIPNEEKIIKLLDAGVKLGL